MTRTVDLVIGGDGPSARAVGVDALRRGGRVLVVLRAGTARQARRLRQYLRRTTGAKSSQLMVMTDAEVVCVDGVATVEAVVVRSSWTGRLLAVNASAFVSFPDPPVVPSGRRAEVRRQRQRAGAGADQGTDHDRD